MPALRREPCRERFSDGPAPRRSEAARFRAGLRTQGTSIMECKVKWIDGVSFVAETGSGHALVMDGAPEGGGRNLGPRPMEMVLLGAGGWTAYDVLVILKKSGQQVSDCS